MAAWNSIQYVVDQVWSSPIHLIYMQDSLTQDRGNQSRCNYFYDHITNKSESSVTGIHTTSLTIPKTIFLKSTQLLVCFRRSWSLQDFALVGCPSFSHLSESLKVWIIFFYHGVFIHDPNILNSMIARLHFCMLWHGRWNSNRLLYLLQRHLSWKPASWWGLLWQHCLC